MDWRQKLSLLILTIATKAIIAIRVEYHTMIHNGNECGIDINKSNCTGGFQEEHELTLDDRPIAIWEKGKPLNCTDLCIKQQNGVIWLNCTPMTSKIVKYSTMCTKDNQLDESILYFRDNQERLSPFLNPTMVAPTGPQANKNKHIGCFVSVIILAVGVAIIVAAVIGKRKKSPATNFCV
ncbi:uncharacterized protein LOC125467267 isoform X2 [Stegostoma tigrinum]|nr:uncharacterized protein LOC125467267 isoform X2 [Stegostoma tigrinum]XP_048418870.1 uncharacterized protein LOC125467267 isoform X2 [Stegostoma tigrinum]